MESFDERIKTINSWLKELLETENIPTFELNEETIKTLERTKLEHDEKQRQNLILRKQMEKETLEFAAEKKRLREILSPLNLDPNQDLNSPHLKSLSKLSSCVDCVHPDSVSMTISMSQFMENFEATKTEFKNETEKQKEFTDGVLKIQDIKIELQKEFSILEKSLNQEKRNAESLKKSTLFFKGKQKEYKKLINDCENCLKNSGFSKSISHCELIKEFNKLQDLENRIKPLKLQLGAYQSLPPDVQRAKLQLCEKLEELRSSEENLQKLLKNVTLND